MNDKKTLDCLKKIILKTAPIFEEVFESSPGLNEERSSQRLSVKEKSASNDLVTFYDNKVEDFLLGELDREFPGVPVLSEESYSRQPDNFQSIKSQDSFFVFDPIDGTTNFSRSYPFFCSTLAWVQKIDENNWECQLGVTFDPNRSEAFSALKGHGAWLNSEAIRCTQVSEPQKALLCTGFASLRQRTESNEEFKTFARLTKDSLGVRRDGSAALDMAYVACGRLDGFWETGLSPWDMITGSLLVQEAGGALGHLAESEPERSLLWDPFRGDVLVSNQSLFKWLLDSIGSTGR